MKKRIVILIICVVVVAQVVTMVAASASFQKTYQAEMVASLEGDVNAMEYALDGVPDDLQAVVDEYRNAYGQDIRITFIDMDGEVLADSEESAAGMDNHADRPEVIQALEGGFGTDVRTSTSTGERTIYTARVIDGVAVLRMAMPMENSMDFVYQALPVMVITFIVLTIAAIVFSGALARGLLSPIGQLYASIRDYLDGEVPVLKIESKYDELDELSVAFTDIAQRLNRYISRVKMENKKSALILDNIREGLMVLDKDQDVLLINTAARKIFGASDDITNVNILHFVRRQEILTKIDRAFQKRKNTLFDIFDEQTGKTYRYHLSFVSEEAFAQSGEGLLVLITDVTDIVQSERVRRDFAANVSHELKTPLTSINGYAQLIANGMTKNEEDTVKSAQNISHEADRLMGLINDTLELSELEQITMDERVEPVSLEEAVQEVEKLLEQKMRDKSIAMHVEGQAEATVNKNRIVQLLLNLCDNAVKYNQEGGNIWVSLSQDESYAVIKVKDDGIGIPEDETERVFERFYRAKNAGGATVSGTGLGLAIAKHIAQLYGGDVGVERGEGGGSEFTVRLKRG